MLSWEIYEFFRSSHWRRCCMENAVLKSFAIFKGKLQTATLLKRDSNTGVFLWILWNCEIFKNIYFEKHLLTAASDFFKIATEHWWAAASALTLLLTLFRMGRGEGRGKKPPPYQFFPCNFYKVGISPQNFLTFSFNPFATLV